MHAGPLQESQVRTGELSDAELFPGGVKLDIQKLDGQMTLSEWRELRHNIFTHGDEYEQLAFKIYQDIVLSPMRGMPQEQIGPLGDFFAKLCADQFAVPNEGIFVRRSTVDEGVKVLGHEYTAGDEAWKAKQSKETLAACNFLDNLDYAINPLQDLDVLKLTAAQQMFGRGLLPDRRMGKRSGPGHGEVEMKPKYDDAVEEDALIKRFHNELRRRVFGGGA